MPALIDLTGQTFGRWKILNRGTNKNRAVYWVCQCQCGTIKEVKGEHLRSGASQSCGCLQKEKAIEIFNQNRNHNKDDLTGQKFGLWTVISDSGKRQSNGSVIWHCRCECGTEKDLERRYLIRGISTHCGCQKKLSKGEEKVIQLLTDNDIKFEIQKTFLDCRFPDTNKVAKFDFYIPKKNYLIEYDGIQHYEITGWATKEKVQEIQQRDQIKNQYCKNNNIPLIRIPYTQYDDLCIEDLLLDTTSFLI